jgi:hypothetical protein
MAAMTQRNKCLDCRYALRYLEGVDGGSKDQFTNWKKEIDDDDDDAG